MTDGRKKRLSMLDSLAAVGTPAPPSMMASNRALRSARDAVDSHRVWDLDPSTIVDDRPADRLDHGDVDDLRDAIETNGQAVPILVRRHPTEPDRYLLVYGRRRLEAIRQSDRIRTVRALVASLDDDAALRSQISENMARRDLSFIERALFARELIDSGFGNQSEVAEVFTVTKSSVSMALAILDGVGVDLARAIGAAPGIGRPRWEALAKALETAPDLRQPALDAAAEAHRTAALSAVTEGERGADDDPSMRAFEAAMKVAATPPAPRPGPGAPRPRSDVRVLRLGGRKAGTLRRTGRGLTLDLTDGPFAAWVETEAQDLLEELHARWQRHAED